jgi:hypothetical protein
MAATRTLPNLGDGQTAILSFTADKFNTVLGPETWKYALFDDSPIMSAAFDWIGGLGSLMWGTIQDNLGLTTEEPEVAAINEGTKATEATTAAISEQPENLKDILKEQLLVQKDILQEIKGDRFAEIEERRESERGEDPIGAIFEKITETTEHGDENAAGWLSNIIHSIIGSRLAAGGIGALAAGGIGATIMGGIMAALPIIGIVALVGAAIMAAFTDISLGIARSSEWDTSKFSSGFGSLLGGQMDVEAGEWVRTLNMAANATKWALIGATLGMVGGPIGMVAGGLIGAAIGAFLGSFGGEYIAKKLDAIGNTLSEFANAIGDWFGEVNDDIVNTVRSWGWTSFGETMDEGEQITAETKKQWGTEYGPGSITTGEQAQLRNYNEETFGVPSLWDTTTPEGRQGMSSFLMEKHPEEKELYTPRMIKLKMNDPEKYNTIRERILERNEGKVARQERDRQIDYYTQMAPKIAQIEEQTGQTGLSKDYFGVLDPKIQQELTLMGMSPTTMAGNIPTQDTPMPAGMNILLGDLGFGGSQAAATAAEGLPPAGVPKAVRTMPEYRRLMVEDAINGTIPGVFTGRTP